MYIVYIYLLIFTKVLNRDSKYLTEIIDGRIKRVNMNTKKKKTRGIVFKLIVGSVVRNFSNIQMYNDFDRHIYSAVTDCRFFDKLL